MTQITIPPEAIQAAWEKYLLDGCGPHAFEAACAAMLNAWPGKDTKDGSDYWVPQIIILPLQEGADDKA